MEPRVYIETSVPSFYYEARSEPDMVSRRQWTRQWWDNFSQDYLLVTSVPVIDELKRGNYPNQKKILQLVSGLALVPLEPAVSEIVEAYIQHKVMSKDPLGDALHLVPHTTNVTFC